jgi:hypothetical protein
MGYPKKEKKRKKEKREKMACPRSMTQKKERKIGRMKVQEKKKKREIYNSIAMSS